MQKIFAPCSTSAFGIVQAMEKRIRDRSEGKQGRRAFSGFLPPLAVQMGQGLCPCRSKSEARETPYAKEVKAASLADTAKL